ncbi:hypothetical protein QTV44_002570 [Vibrio vulnificus]|nr:hypothetical protein [Vibrio vulnificus]
MGKITSLTSADLYFFGQLSGVDGLIHHDALYALSQQTDAISTFLRNYLGGYLVRDVIATLHSDHVFLFAVPTTTNDLRISHQFARACSVRLLTDNAVIGLENEYNALRQSRDFFNDYVDDVRRAQVFIIEQIAMNLRDRSIRFNSTVDKLIASLIHEHILLPLRSITATQCRMGILSQGLSFFFPLAIRRNTSLNDLSRRFAREPVKAYSYNLLLSEARHCAPEFGGAALGLVEQLIVNNSVINDESVAYRLRHESLVELAMLERTYVSSSVKTQFPAVH